MSTKEQQITNSIEEQIDTFNSVFEQLLEKEQTDTDRVRNQHLRNVARLKDDIKKLDEQHREAEQMRDEDEKKAELARVGVEELVRTSKAAEAEAKVLPVRLQALEKKRAELEEELSRSLEALKLESAGREEQLSFIETALAFYRNRLGLEFQQVKGDGVSAPPLRVVFRRIDAERPDKEFHFSFKVDDHNSYRVVSCEPELARMPALLEELNKSQNEKRALSHFIQRVRQQFVLSVTPAAASAE